MNVRLLADENVHAQVVRSLRSRGWEVEFIAETSAGASDAQILARTDISEFVLITYDSDFGELIFKHAMPRPDLLIYSRLGRAEPRYVADRIIDILENSPESGNCYVILANGIRVRPFTAGSMFDV